MGKARIWGACAVASLGLFAAACVPPEPGTTNVVPVASATATPDTGDAPLEVEFSSAGSVDPDGTIATYAWNFGDSTTSAVANPTHVYNAAGIYLVTLTVTDNQGATGSTTLTITVDVTPNQAPTAAASATPDNGVAPVEVQFSSAGSGDTDGTIASYAWDFGDGGSSTEADPAHTYATDGTFTATLVVTDDDGATATASVTVTVTAPVVDDPNGRYVATTGADTGDCSTSAAPCLTINYAVGQAVAGNTVYVAAGSYGEIVNPSKALTFKGANAGVPAGVDAAARGPESVVRGFRTSTTAIAASNNFVLDGFEVNPTSDPTLLTNATGIINIFGGPTVSIVNNVFTGGAAFVPNCGFTCTAMGDYAMEIRGGDIDVSENRFVNWRRPLNFTQNNAALPINGASITDNVFTGITSRAMSIGQATGQTTMGGVLVEGNQVDATGRDAVASTPAGITITNNSNQIKDNTFTDLSSGVYIQLCKKSLTQNNAVTGNAFNNNGAGVNVTTFLDTSQCNRSPTPGTDGWVIGGGTANGLQVTGNTFTGASSSYAVRFNPNYGTYVDVTTVGPLDATCNFYGSAAGPVGNQGIVQGPVTNAQINATPWLTSAGGACDGGV